MKNLIRILVVLLVASPAQAWVFLDELNPNAGSWLLPKILSGRPVRVCVDVLDKQADASSPRRYKVVPYKGENLQPYYQQSATIVQLAYQSWFDELAAQIQQNKRKKEFKDLLARIPKKVPFVFINAPQSAQPYASCEELPARDIDLRVRATLFKQSAGGYAVQQGRAAFTFWFQPDNTGVTAWDEPQFVLKAVPSLQIAMHEAGHTLGLGDLYEGDHNPENSPVYTLAEFYAAQSLRSIMNKANALTCDDADGLANLMDFFAPNTPSARAEKGWVSLCPNYQVAYSRALPFALNTAQKDALLAFAADGWKGASPAQEQIDAARQAASRKEQSSRNTQAQSRQAQDALKQALTASPRQAAPQYKPHVCALCGKEIEEAGSVRLSYAKKGVWAFLHSSCNDKRKTQGAKIPPGNLAKYGEPMK